MTKNANYVSHKKSRLKNQDGSPQLPSASALIEGEIAINFAENVETLSIKNESGTVVTFSSDNYYTEQKLGSGFTGANSAITVTNVIEGNERVISAALNDLNEKKLDASAYTPTDLSNYYTKDETSGKTEISNALQGKINTSTYTAYTASTAIEIENKLNTSDFNIYSGAVDTIIGSGFTSSSITEVIIKNELITSSALNDLEANKLDVSAYTPTVELWVSGTGLNSAVLKGSSGVASGNYSIAEGYSTSATSDYSHTEGYNTLASKNSSHAEGRNTIASGHTSHAEGNMTEANGDYSHAEGAGTVTRGESSHAEGQDTEANGDYSHAEGESTSATNESSHAEGYATLASGVYSHAEGDTTSATNYSSHAEGWKTLASGDTSHAEGSETLASGVYSHAEGDTTSATSDSSHAEGYYTNANGYASHAEGSETLAIGDASHAEGDNTTASGNSSHAEGYGTVALNKAEHASGQYNVSSSGSSTFGDSGNTLFSVGNGTASDARHNAFEIRQNGDIYIVSGGTNIKLQDNIGGGGGSITVDQVLDNTTSASTNPVSSKAVYDAVTDNELVWTNAYVAMSGITSAHTANTEIHVTAADKEKLHTHSNKTALDSITGNVGTMAYQNTNSYSSATQVNTALGNKANTSDLASYADSVKYNSTSHYVEFYHGTTAGTKVFEYDASPFIIDGMVDDVRIENGNLVIDFNTASGKQDISIPLTDIFDPSNYYDKDDIDDLVGSGFTLSSITDVIIENEEIVSAALTDLDERKLDASAYTPTDLSNYYTKSETSGKTEISNALGGKSDTGHTHVIGDITNLQTTLDGKASTATTLAGYGITNAYTKSETSGATEISNALGAKVNTSDIISAITPSNSGSTAPIATKVVAENELVMANALNDLNSRKLDASAYTTTSAVTSGSTDAITSGGVYAQMDGIKLKKITQSAYDALVQAGTVDTNTLYVITD